jgi:hypothetical protein
MKTFRAKTMVELKAAIYAHHGWRRVYGENMSARIKALYDVTADHQRNQLVARPKPAQSGPAP